jgi:hypothetical protein
MTWFQVAKRAVISCRYWAAVSRWRRDRKCGNIPLNADRNRCACPGEVNSGGGLGVTVGGDQDVQDIPILVNRPPQVVGLA